MNEGSGSTSSAQRPAAFFDLDKTVIARSSTLAFSKPFFEEGLINRRAVLKSSYAQFLFLLSGADHEQTDRLRSHITSMCEGWDVAQVESIVQETLHDIVTPFVFGEAAALISDHIARGHDVIVVSASGAEIVTPIAMALGAKHALASRMAIRDGRYTGELEFFCHGAAKVHAIQDLADREGYDLRVSHAYSNSAADIPMLEAVGHPTAVNPDRQLRREAAARGWPVLTFSNPVSLRAQLPAPSTKTVAATAALGASAVLAAGAAAFAYFRRRK